MVQMCRKQKTLQGGKVQWQSAHNDDGGLFELQGKQCTSFFKTQRHYWCSLIHGLPCDFIFTKIGNINVGYFLCSAIDQVQEGDHEKLDLPSSDLVFSSHLPFASF